jgi:hypothetical protein
VVTKEHGSPIVAAGNKKNKQKGIHHGFEWENLENPNVQSKKGWKHEKEEY